MSTHWNPARVQAELNTAISLREAGNQAFRSGDYKTSTEKYGDANYDILWLKGLRYSAGPSAFNRSVLESMIEAQFTTQSNEAASWLKYDSYSGEGNRFTKALGCTSMAQEALRGPTSWKPSEKAMRKLLYRRASAYEGLDNYDGAWDAIREAHGLSSEKDEAVCELATRVWNVRQFGKDTVGQGFMPIESDFFSKPYRKENYDRLKRCRLCDP